MNRKQKHPEERANWKIFAGFILLYIAVSSGVVIPLLRTFSYLLLRVSGFRYLTAENFRLLLYNPFLYLALSAAGVFYSCFMLFEISGIIYIQDRSREKQRTYLSETLLFAFQNVRGIFARHYIGLLLPVLVITPIYHLASAVNLLNSYSNVAIFMRMLRRQWYLRILAVFSVLFFILLLLRWFYACHYYTLEDYNLRQASRQSRRLMKSQRVRDILPVFGRLLLAVLIYILFNLAGIAIIGLGKRAGFSGAAVSSVQVTFMNVCAHLFNALAAPLLLSGIGRLYYQGKTAAGEPLLYADKVLRYAKNKNLLLNRLTQRRFLEAGILLLSLGAFLFYMQSSARSQFKLRIEHLSTVEVTAHRGASMFYPENTLSAFQGAVEQGADWIELDVQESKDGHIIVMHDESLKRTTGVDMKSWELDYSEIAALDAGSFFNSDYANEYIPLLSEVIAFAAENNIRLNIELKPNDQQKGLVDGVLDLVEEAGFESSCVITSQKYDVLRQVKKRNENIYTVYVMGLAYGAVNRLNAADAFSIQSNSITQSLVTDLHNRGREVYAWTVDSRANLNRMINLGVDNIITNNVPLAIECINDSRTNSILSELLKMLRERFR